ncbi:peptidoglycan-binding protein [Salipaludibacillus sp. HK11]|uniref:peptidoglycan-binding protein n=1 Tax=Salipaludibacillus sp. HK11 TaxID=3394320 RepID=UPI0039FD1CB4
MRWKNIILFTFLTLFAIVIFPGSSIAEDNGQVVEESNEVNDSSDSDSQETDEETTEPKEDKGDVEEDAESNEPEDQGSEEEIDEETVESQGESDTQVDSENENEDSEMKVMNATSNSDFKVGDNHERIIDLKEGLNQIGFGTILVTDYFGNFTETQVRAFQDYYGLPVTGIADEATFEKLDSILDHPYQNGKSHANLADFKVKLNWIGYGHILVTENFGSWMESRVEAFQRDHNLAVSGIIEPVTEAKINETFASIFKVNNRHASIVDLKEMLNQTSFGGILVSDLYGSFTSTRVRQFQEHYELEVTGEANIETLKKLEDILDTPFQEGIRHPDTVELKEGLNRLGFGPILVSDLYGSFTKHQVAAFQETYGLSPTGIATDATWAKMNDLLDSPLQEGRSHNDLIEIKEKLNWTGYGHIVVTENYGSWMASRVRSFQRDHDLPVSGIIDDKTRAAIESTFEQGFTVGKRNPGVIEMKKGLNKLGFGNILVSDLFGSFTARQVASFQDYYGLGTSVQATLDKIEELLDTPLQQGRSHQDLIDIKHKLNWTGYGHIVVTENYGSWMASRVRSFQDDHGLPVSGMIDDKTKAAIDRTFEKGFTEGNRNPGVIEMKEGLNKLGFGNILVSDLYGSFTAQQVRSFQEYYGLDATGKANLATLHKIEELLDSPLQQGRSHSDLPALKEKLNQLGFGEILISDYFGSFTTLRVQQFQDYYGLIVNGMLDEPTQQKINDVLNSPFSEGNRHDDTPALKQKLNHLGFGYISETTLFGSYMKQKVEEFQGHFDLAVNGIADEPTRRKINDVFNSPYQVGKSHPDMIGFKEQLNDIGYGYISISETFGDFTEQKVKQFQEDMGLPVSGILDEVTIRVLQSTFERQPITLYTEYPISLEDALDIQMSMNPPPQTDKYRNDPGFVRTSNLDFFERGAITGSGVNVRTEPDSGSGSGNIEANLSNGTTFDYIKTVRGNSVGGSRDWYEIRYDGKTLYVHSSLASKDGGSYAKLKTASNIYQSNSTNSHIFYRASSGSEFSIVQRGSTWTQLSVRTWRNAKRNEAKEYFDPEKQDIFQHLVLSSSPEVSSSQINNILNDRGILHGKGAAFIQGAREHGVNEIYLISHAFLETGSGSSQLSTGVRVGKNSNGTLVLETPSNKNNLTDTKTTYNMFGIGAFDSDAHRAGAVRAYEEGWFTPESAIVGGAKFIGERYIHNAYGQNTIYKMRWNPANPGYPQYATDMAWAAKQVATIKSMYNQLEQPMMVFDIPKYR